MRKVLPMATYFDHNATTPMSEAARDAWLKAETEHWHNPSSLYREAGVAKRLLEDLREELADRLGCDQPDRVVFTSGASEANNAVMRMVSAGVKAGRRVAISAIEHPSVDEAARTFFDEVIEIPVDADTGAADAGAIQLGDISLVSVMAANNETGTLHPWREIAAKCRDAGVLFHCDAAQWLGKMPAEGVTGCDFVSGCAHKFGGPKGVGFLLLPANESVASLFKLAVGGPQENRHRAGTENLPGIAAMLAALREHDDFLQGGARHHMAARRDAFEAEVLAGIDGSEVIGGGAERLWNTSMMVVPRHRNVKWLTRLSRRDFCVSTGSACSAGKGNPSNVMAAMGLSHEAMGRVIRISGGWQTTGEDWLAMAAAMIEVGAELDSGERTQPEPRKLF